MSATTPILDPSRRHHRNSADRPSPPEPARTGHAGAATGTATITDT